MFVSAQKFVSGIDSFTLLAVPFFVLAGLLMSSGGMSKTAD
ncbi:MAG: TRAP transporter large permease subunit [Enterocloster clostridioformis]